MKQSTRHLIELYMTGVIALGQSAHYIQAWKIFVTQSASDMSLLSYSIYFTLLLHAFGYSILINKKLLIPSWNVFEIKYKYLEDLSDLKNYMRSALRGCRV